MILQTVRLTSPLAEEELLAKARERAPEFRAIPGLVQKYYVSHDEEGQYAGVYVWDSLESMEAFRASDLAKSIGRAYQVSAPPEVEVSEILFPLRDGVEG